MNDKELEAIYTAGNAASHATGLRAVFEAGRLSVVIPVVKIIPNIPKVMKKVKAKGKKKKW